MPLGPEPNAPSFFFARYAMAWHGSKYSQTKRPEAVFGLRSNALAITLQWIHYQLSYAVQI